MYTSRFSDTDQLKMGLRARKLQGAIEKQASAGRHRTRVALVEGECSHHYSNPAPLNIGHFGYVIFLYRRQAVEFF